MKEDKIKFIKRNIAFIIILLAVLSIINIGYMKISQEKRLYRSEKIYAEFIENNKEIDFAIIGDSHPKDGLNPMYLNNSFNFANYDENYIESYFKIKKIIEIDKIKLNALILQLDLHSFSTKIRTKERLFNELDHYTSFIEPKKIASLKGESELAVRIKGMFPVIGNGRKLLINSIRLFDLDPIYLGWNNRSRNFSETDMEKLAYTKYLRQFGKNPKRIEKTSFEYFLKIIEYAKENNIKIIFIKYPVSKEYNNVLVKNSITKKNYYSTIFKNIGSITKDYTVLDYYTLFFNHSDYFHDPEHLNHIGARILTINVSKDLLEKD